MYLDWSPFEPQDPLDERDFTHSIATQVTGSGIRRGDLVVAVNGETLGNRRPVFRSEGEAREFVCKLFQLNPHVHTWLWATVYKGKGSPIDKDRNGGDGRIRADGLERLCGCRPIAKRASRDAGSAATVASKPAFKETAPVRIQRTVNLVERDPAPVAYVKALYDHRCQVCGIRLESPTGAFCEAAHIRPLGSDHKGIDDSSNILVLCPNHHQLFDRGGIRVTDRWDVVDVVNRKKIGKLLRVTAHAIDKDALAYRRKLISAKRA